MLPRGRAVKPLTPARELEYYITMHATEARAVGWEVAGSVATKVFVTADGAFTARVSHNKSNTHPGKPWVLVIKRRADGLRPVDTLHENAAEALNAANSFFGGP